MPFGLKNAPAVFQRIINTVLQKQIGKTCFAYLDDVIVFSENPEDHEKHVEDVLVALEKANLKLKSSKCKWFKSEVNLLGFTISGEGIKSDPDKVSAIRNLKAPKNIKGVR